MANEEAVLKTRIVQKHDIEANWIKAGKAAFTPLKGELIIYDADSTNAKQRIKIGDGRTNINQLKFFGNEWDYILDNSYSKINWDDYDGFARPDGTTFFNGISGKVYVDIDLPVGQSSISFVVPNTITHLHLENFFRIEEFDGSGGKISGSHSVKAQFRNFSDVQGLTGIFINCDHLSDCVGDSSVTSSSNYGCTFQNCTYIHNCSSPVNTTSQGTGTFTNCSFLDTIVINGSFALNDDYIFNNCHHLNNIKISEDITIMGGHETRAGFYGGCTHVDAFTCDRYIEQVGKDKLLVTGETDAVTFIDRPTKVSAFTNDAEYVTESELNPKGYATETYVNNTFSNALKGKAYDSAITIADISPITHEMDVAVRSKNLIPYPYTHTTFTMNGVTFTANEDGTVTANGTATDLTYLVLVNNMSLKAGTYSISDGFTIPNSNGYKILGVVTKSGGTVSYMSTTTAANATVSFTEDVTINIRVQVETGITVENLVFKPQLELGSTATAYAPYVGDLTAVTVKRQGKNLLDYKTIESAGYATPTLIDNGFRLEGKWYALIKNFPVLPNTNYRLSYTLKNIVGTTQQVAIFGDSILSEKIAIYYNERGGSFNSGAHNSIYIGFYCGSSESGTVDFTNIQLELGSTATDYEEYIAPTEYIPKADGIVEGVTSIYPNTTLTTDTDGVVIDCEYNRDINKAFAELQAAIISLGGNI